LFIQGGGSEEDYAADAKLFASFQEVLGEAYVVHYPRLLDEPAPDFGRKKKIGNEISSIKGEVILVGHSLGASMLLKYLSENKIKKRIRGVFLISTPFWSGDEDWQQGPKLQEGFADRLPKGIPIFLYHCTMTKSYHSTSPMKLRLPIPTKNCPYGLKTSTEEN